ncbi:hypothetical protein HDU93_001427, partial [Gonapodya sp. JEL0774]
MVNKKALLIGINYRGSGNDLRGCINDVANIYNYLTRYAGYKPSQIVVMTEDARNPKFIPTYKNLIGGFRWLTQNNKAGDHLFMHYSGHGSTVQDPVDSRPGHPDFDDTIVPLDFKTAGQITSTDLHKMLVSSIPKTVKMTIIFDCCHSGTMLELPFTFRPDAQGRVGLKEFTEYYRQRARQNAKAVFGLKSTPKQRLGGAKQVIGDVKDIFQKLEQLDKFGSSAFGKPGNSELDVEEEFDDWEHEGRNVFCFSGCMDHQTSADTEKSGTAVGAMSWALLTSLQQNPRQSYSSLLKTTRQMLAKEYSQIPQLSVGIIMVNKKALLIGINYRGSEQELKGCINDVSNIYHYLTRSAGYRQDQIVVMTEDAEKPSFLPTSHNIIAGFKWLVQNNDSGDHLFMHYSGHGSQVQDPVDSRPGHPDFDDTIVPLDYKTAGQITSTVSDIRTLQSRTSKLNNTPHISLMSKRRLELPFTFRPDAQGHIGLKEFHEYYKKRAISNTKIAFGHKVDIKTRIGAAKEMIKDAKEIFHKLEQLDKFGGAAAFADGGAAAKAAQLDAEEEFD